MRKAQFLFWLALACLPMAGQRTALDRYVNTPDPAFRYEVVSSVSTAGVSVFVLEMVSQNWLTAAEVDRPEWRHWLVIIRPAEVRHSTALLYLSGGSNDGRPPSPVDLALSLVAVETGAVVAELRMVPNQPLRFAGDGVPRSEDSLVAYSWRKFLETGDPRWPARLPMTKAAVRAMDAVQQFAATQRFGGVKIDRFAVGGGSKRGWTAWTTAAVDRRVIALLPQVIDVLSVEASLAHHWRAYGFWAPAITDYVDNGIMNWFGRPEMRKLLEIEDPFAYRHRLSLPKFLVHSAGDQFFLPDSSQFYFRDLPGEKYLRYVPNSDHSLEGTDAALSILAWLDAFLNNRPRPRFYWEVDRPNGVLQLVTVDPPDEVRLWKAANPKARDFRLESIGRAWTSEPWTGEDGVYTVAMPAPAQGFSAFFLEMTYPSGGRVPFTFTTEVAVTPDVYPFEPPPGAAGELPGGHVAKRDAH